MVDIVVEGKSEASISYKFRPSEYLAAMPYRFFSMIEYNDGKGQRYFNVLFNETLAFTEANVAFDVELIATYLLIIGFVAGMGYLAYTCFQKKTVCKPLFPSSPFQTLLYRFSRFLCMFAMQRNAGQGQEGCCCKGCRACRACGPREERVARRHGGARAHEAGEEGEEVKEELSSETPQTRATRRLLCTPRTRSTSLLFFFSLETNYISTTTTVPARVNRRGQSARDSSSSW